MIKKTNPKRPDRLKENNRITSAIMQLEKKNLSCFSSRFLVPYWQCNSFICGWLLHYFFFLKIKFDSRNVLAFTLNGSLQKNLKTWKKYNKLTKSTVLENELKRFIITPKKAWYFLLLVLIILVDSLINILLLFNPRAFKVTRTIGS